MSEGMTAEQALIKEMRDRLEQETEQYVCCGFGVDDDYSDRQCCGQPESDWPDDVAELLARADKALAAPALSRPAVPEGWKLVPVEPTEEMLRMAIRTQEVAPEWTKHVGALGVAAETYSRYKAMLSAAPEPPCSE